LKQNLQKTKEKYEKYSQDTDKAQKAFEAAKLQDKPANELLRVCIMLGNSNNGKMTGKVQKYAKETMMFERETQDCTNKLASFQTVLAAKMANIYDVKQQCFAFVNSVSSYKSRKRRELISLNFISLNLLLQWKQTQAMCLLLVLA
jgi:hypothetical protein